MSLGERPRGSARPTPNEHYNSLLRTSIEGALVSRSVEQEGYHCAEQQQDIQPHRPVAHVTSVHLYSFAEESAVAPGDLPWAGDPWRYAQYLALGDPNLLGLARQVGSGVNQAQLLPQHVPQLWQLVEARLAQEAADARYAGIVAQLVVLRILFPELGVFFQHFLQQGFSVRDMVWNLMHENSSPSLLMRKSL